MPLRTPPHLPSSDELRSSRPWILAYLVSLLLDTSSPQFSFQILPEGSGMVGQAPGMEEVEWRGREEYRCRRRWSRGRMDAQRRVAESVPSQAPDLPVPALERPSRVCKVRLFGWQWRRRRKRSAREKLIDSGKERGGRGARQQLHHGRGSGVGREKVKVCRWRGAGREWSRGPKSGNGPPVFHCRQYGSTGGD